MGSRFQELLFCDIAVLLTFVKNVKPWHFGMVVLWECLLQCSLVLLVEYWGNCLCYINGPIFDNRNPLVREECFPHLLDSEGCSSCGGNHGCMRWGSGFCWIFCCKLMSFSCRRFSCFCCSMMDWPFVVFSYTLSNNGNIVIKFSNSNIFKPSQKLFDLSYGFMGQSKIFIKMSFKVFK
jgi:hypothetical protein